MRAMFSLLLGAFWPLSEPLFRMVNPAADTAADFNRSRRCIWADPLAYIVADSEYDRAAKWRSFMAFLKARSPARKIQPYAAGPALPEPHITSALAHAAAHRPSHRLQKAGQFPA